MTRFTAIRCGQCGEIAPAVVNTERRRLITMLTTARWRLTLGEATCPKCAADWEALDAAVSTNAKRSA